MTLTNIGQQKTPGRPIEITFAAETGIPSDAQEVLLIGHAVSGFAASGLYKSITIDNSGDRIAASGECVTKGFGAVSEITKMVLAAIKANEGGSTFPQIKVVLLAAADVDFGALDVALTGSAKVKAEFMVSPYAGTDLTLTGKLKETALLMSGAQRVENSQNGTIGVVAAMNVASPSSLNAYDSQFLCGIYLRDQGSNPYSVAELASAAAAKMAANGIPFNPIDDVTINGVTKPANSDDNLTIGASLESEVTLQKGWTPLKVKPNGEVAFVRTVTMRLSADGTGNPIVGAYYDVQDFQVLYFWRKTLFTRFSAPDFKKKKASVDTAKLVKSELIRLATTFQDEQMFQAVDKLAKFFQVERNASDRSRFDYKTPVNVIPGLHVVAGNIEAGTQFDVITI